MSETFKVRITKCSGEGYWYKHKVGEVFEIEGEDCDDYKVIGGVYWIEKKDCERIPANTHVHEGKVYALPSWVKHVTCDGKGKPVFGWAEKPVFDKDSKAFYTADGRRTMLKLYVEPLPEGAYIKEVV
jgi:hypothetical protein